MSEGSAKYGAFCLFGASFGGTGGQLLPIIYVFTFRVVSVCFMVGWLRFIRQVGENLVDEL